MLDSLLVVLPIFALILTGWIARRSGALGPTATGEVNRLVVNLALPALLFDIVTRAEPADLWQPGFITAFGLGLAVVFVGTTLVSRARGRHLADAAIDGLNAGYPNTGYVGFPLVIVLFGQSGLGVTLLATIMTACVLFAVGLAVIESALHSGTRREIATKTIVSLARNPLVIAPVLGAAVLFSGIPMPEAASRFVEMLGAAASPCALVALGLFLADDNGSESGSIATTTALTGLKLVVQPAITWVIAVPILDLPPMTAAIAVLIAALPTGTGPFMLAQKYNRSAALTARMVLVTTLISVVTLSALISLVGRPA